ncbi:methyltransferase domain-containing protein [Vibrio hannami]|uniref:methyltransferase domain-containing protein n=1 Tax=Vibrio hannami TaxID=2717094 RepID=UPI00240F7D9E|nr:methyltransferase domain-containing protein [Vibrio hannami]MDG3085743.1 methyltransferase domain-containing protein [Vibrio hannami]
MNTFAYDESLAKKQEQIAATSDMCIQRKTILDCANISAGEQVIDIGCGNGILARDMLEYVGKEGEVYGLDSVVPMVELASSLCSQGNFILGSVDDMPLEDEQFDVITASQLFCFLPQPEKALAECWRILRRRGRLIVLDTDWDSLIWHSLEPSLFQQIKHNMLKRYTDAHLPRTLSNKLTDAGFTLIQRKSLPIVNWQLTRDTFSQQLLNLLKPKGESATAEAIELWEQWQQALKAIDERGEYMFSVNRYIFVVEKQ